MVIDVRVEGVELGDTDRLGEQAALRECVGLRLGRHPGTTSTGEATEDHGDSNGKGGAQDQRSVNGTAAAPTALSQVLGPVDALLHRGRVHFGTAPSAFRARHLHRSPGVSATYVEGEGLVVTVHGYVRRLDLRGEDADFAEVTRQQYGEGWDRWEPSPPAWAIEPERMFAADMRVHTSGAAS